MDSSHPNRGPGVLAVSASTLVLCSIFVAFRLISRFAIVKKPGWDDYTIILAWVLAFGTSLSICYGTTKGLGRHQDDVPPEWESPMKKAAYAFSALYNPALMATKSSILIFFLSLSKTQKIFRRATIATLIIVNTGGLALTLLNILQCQPVNAAFKTPVPSSASCTNIVTIYLSSAPLNIITDLFIFFLPMPILTSMRLPKKQKIILVITFGFGIFVAVVDVVRIAYLQEAQRYNLRAVQSHQDNIDDDVRNTSDFSWYASLSFMWSAVEINLGIMVACVPALKPLVRRFLPTWILDHTVGEKSNSGTFGSDSAVHPDIVDSRRRSNLQTPPQSPLTKSPPPLAKPPPALSGPSENMDMLEFLTTPDMGGMSSINQSQTVGTAPTTIAPLRRPSMTFFDFVDMGRKKNITLRSNSESVYPVLMVTILFFIWGFAYGLLDALNAQFQAVAGMTDWQTVGQHSAYFVGYTLGPLTFGRYIFRTWGFKACYMVGLVIYSCGTLIFWPSAVLTSFPAFLISNFIAGAGLSTLEISANPFIALCGPPEYSEVRLNMSQAVQAIGTVVSPLLAKKVLFKAQANNLIDVQWTYLGISFLTVILAVIYYYVPLPEATDEELETASARMPIPREATMKVGSKYVKVIWITLGLGVFSQFCYVGGQETSATSFGEFLTKVEPSLDIVTHQAIGHTAFAVSRFIAAFANVWIKPRYILLFFFLGAVAFSVAAMYGTGATPASIIIILMFFEGPLFPQIYAQVLRGMGKHTKDASVLLTAAIGGGGVFPPIMFGVLKAHGVRYAFSVTIAAFAAGTIYPLWLNALPSTRMLSDPVRDEQTRRESGSDDSEGRRPSAGSKMAKRWSKVRNRLSRDKEKDELPTVEHRERRSWPELQVPSEGTSTSSSSGRSLDITPADRSPKSKNERFSPPVGEA